MWRVVVQNCAKSCVSSIIPCSMLVLEAETSMPQKKNINCWFSQNKKTKTKEKKPTTESRRLELGDERNGLKEIFKEYSIHSLVKIPFQSKRNTYLLNDINFNNQLYSHFENNQTKYDWWLVSSTSNKFSSLYKNLDFKFCLHKKLNVLV